MDRFLAAVAGAALLATVIAIGNIVYDGSLEGYAHLIGMVLGIYVVMTIVAFLSRGRVSKSPLTAGKLTVAFLILVVTNTRDVMLSLDTREAKAVMQTARGPEDIVRLASEHPSNAMLKMLAYMVTLRSEETSNFNAITHAVLPKGLPDFSTVGSMDLARLDAYIDMLRQGEDNARGLAEATRRINATYREKIETYAKGMGSDEIKRNAMIGFDHASSMTQQRNDKLGQDEATALHAMRAQAIFLAQRFGTWSLQNGLIFKDQATLDAWNTLDGERTKALVAYQRTLQENNAISQRRDQSALKKLSQ